MHGATLDLPNAADQATRGMALKLHLGYEWHFRGHLTSKVLLNQDYMKTMRRGESWDDGGVSLLFLPLENGLVK